MRNSVVCVFLLLIILHFFSAFSKPLFSAEITQVPVLNKLIDIFVLPSEIKGNIAMRQGTYSISELLSVKVLSTQPDWYIEIYSEALKSDYGQINPGEIYAITGTQAISLAKSCLVSDSYKPGETNLSIPIELHTTEQHKPGTYTGQLRITVGYPGSLIAETIAVPLEIEVTCHISGSISDNKIYFHYGLPGEKIRASAKGEIKTDTDIYLSLTSTNGKVNQLPMIKSVSSKICNENNFIPLIWELRHNGNGWKEPSYVSYDGGEIIWQLDGNTEQIIYELQCSPQPDAAQAPGNYGMSVVMMVVPLL